MHPRVFLLLASLVLLGAAGLRIVDLSRYPPGLHYDEAADMLLSRDIAFYGFRPFPVVAAYSGREALFYYLAAPLVRLFGLEVGADGMIMATRLTSAALGLLAVAATLALGKALFRDRALALLAAGWLAVNGPQVWLTRQGFRTSPQPALEAVGLWLLWVALRRDRRWFLPAILAGISSGLTLYVYMAARVFPAWLVGLLVLLIVIDPAQRGLRIKQVGAFLGAMSITAMPIAAYYLTNLSVLTDRLSQLAPSGDTLTFAQSLLVHAEMFFLRGDPLLRYNLYPGRPFFDPLSGALLVIGLAVCLWGVIARRPPLDRVAAAFVLLSPLLVAPSVIAVGGLPPSHMRSVAMVPLICFAPALGARLVGSLIATRWQRRQLQRDPQAQPGQSGLRRHRWLGASALALLFLTLGGWTWRDYQAWGSRADLFYDSDGDLNLAAAWLVQHAAPDTLLYIASTYYQHPTILAHQVDPSRVRWMMAEHLFLPPSDREALLVFPRSVKPPDGGWGAWLPPRWQVAEVPAGPDATPAFTAYRVPPEDRPQVAQASQAAAAPIANVAGVFVLEAAAFAEAHSGRQADLTLVWRVLRSPGRDDVAPVISVTDAWGTEIARAHPYIEYSGGWLPGETLIQRLRVPIPAGNPPGTYQVKVAWVGKSRPNDYLPLQDAQERFAGIWATAGELRVMVGDPSPPPPPEAISRRVTPDVWLVSVAGMPPVIGQGMTLGFTLDWYAARSAPGGPPLKLVARRLHRPEDAGGVDLLLWEGHPVRGTYPMARWSAGERVTDRHNVTIPPDFPPGDYTLRLLLGESPAFESALRVEAVERHFELPPLATSVDLSFGDALTLRGYQVERAGSSDIDITLAWRAVRPPDRDYTVFVHIVGADGVNFSQRDEQPARPTSQWIAGEVMVTRYRLPLPPGAFTIRAGMYVQDDGRRLDIRGPAGERFGDFLELAPNLSR